MARKRTPIRYSGKTYSSYAALAREYDINPSTLATTRQRIKKENKSLSQTQVLERAMVSILKKQIQAVDSGDLLVEIKQLKKELHEVKNRLNIVESEMNQPKAQKDVPKNIKNVSDNKPSAKEKALKTPKFASESNLKEEHIHHDLTTVVQEARARGKASKGNPQEKHIHSDLTTVVQGARARGKASKDNPQEEHGEQHLTPAERNAQRRQQKEQETRERQLKEQTPAHTETYQGWTLINIFVGITPEDKAIRIEVLNKSTAKQIEQWKNGDESIKSLTIPYTNNKMPKDNFIGITVRLDPKTKYKDVLKWEKFTSNSNKTRYGVTFDTTKLPKQDAELPKKVLNRIRSSNSLSEEEYSKAEERNKVMTDFKLPEFL